MNRAPVAKTACMCAADGTFVCSSSSSASASSGSSGSSAGATVPDSAMKLLMMETFAERPNKGPVGPEMFEDAPLGAGKWDVKSAAMGKRPAKA